MCTLDTVVTATHTAFLSETFVEDALHSLTSPSRLKNLVVKIFHRANFVPPCNTTLDHHHVLFLLSYPVQSCWTKCQAYLNFTEDFWHLSGEHEALKVF